jgi:hypothetical protein
MSVTKIQFRRDTEANWLSVDPILHEGELGYDTTNKRFKIGDGYSIWSDLVYANTPDSNIPHAGIDYIAFSEKGAPSGVAELDADGYVPTSQLPPLVKVTVHSVANQTARLALTVEPGDIAIQADTGGTYVLESVPASTNSNWKLITVSEKAI